jgi:hypothetical protein
MTDGELQWLARSAESLTELAWDALEDEMDRRHLEFAHDAPPEPRQEVEVRELVTIRQFRDLPEEELPEKGFPGLRSGGCERRGDGMGRGVRLSSFQPTNRGSECFPIWLVSSGQATNRRPT